MNPEAKKTYIKLCHSNTSIPLFCQNWWLDAVCGPEYWNVSLVEKGGTVLGALPYFYSKKKGFKMIKMPPLTQTLGPLLFYPSGQKLSTRTSFEKKIITSLIEDLPPFDVFHQHFHYSVSNWLPFYWKDFHQTSRYTYILEDLSDLETIFSQFRSNIKTDIRKANQQVIISISDDIDKFISLWNKTFKRQNLNPPFSSNFLLTLDQTCKQKKCREIFIAEDKEGNAHAAAYIVWDSREAYYLMSGSDPKYRNNGAMSLVLWEAIQFCAAKGLKFNFEGSMIENVERYFRSFGAFQIPYYQVSKIDSNIYRILHGAKKLLNHWIPTSK